MGGKVALERISRTSVRTILETIQTETSDDQDFFIEALVPPSGLPDEDARVNLARSP